MNRFEETAIDWVAAAKHGISRRMLQECGLLDLLLEGSTTPLIPLCLSFNGIQIKLDATIQLIEDRDNNARFKILGYGWEE